MVVFTDASGDNNVALWGVVILDEQTGVRKVFWGQVPADFVELWSSAVGKQIICEAEMYAVLLAMAYVGTHFPKRCAIFWIENDACRF